VLTFGRHTE